MARVPSLFIRPDPFSADPLSDSFLPSKGLFSPVASSSRATPNFCSTIFEEDDDEDRRQEEDDLDFDSDSDTITSRSRLPSSIAIHPRILRADSTSDDDASDFPPVLRFPLPPKSSPSPPRRQSSLPIPPPPQPELKSCFEDYDDDYVSPLTLIASRPAPSPPKTPAPLALLKRATNALKSSSPKADKPLPRLPHTAFEYHRSSHRESVSPTPSLSSSSSSSLDSATAPYIPVGSIIPAPTVVEDFDEYVETLEMYFPSSLWATDDMHHHNPPALAKRTSSRQQLYSPVSHSRTSSAESNLSSSSFEFASSSSRRSSRRPSTAPTNQRALSNSPPSSRRPSSSSSNSAMIPTKPSPPPAKGILKSSRSTPHLRARASTTSSLLPPSSSRSSRQPHPFSQ